MFVLLLMIPENHVSCQQCTQNRLSIKYILWKTPIQQSIIRFFPKYHRFLIAYLSFVQNITIAVVRAQETYSYQSTTKFMNGEKASKRLFSVKCCHTFSQSKNEVVIITLMTCLLFILKGSKITAKNKFLLGEYSKGIFAFSKQTIYLFD